MCAERMDGGGNILLPQTKVVRRTAAVGDIIAASVVVDKLADLGYQIVFQAHPSLQAALRCHARVKHVTSPGSFCHVNLDGAYEKHPFRRQRHFYGLFMDKARAELRMQGVDLGPAINCRPRICPTPAGNGAARLILSKHARPWIFVCPRSENYRVRQIPDGIWQEVAKRTPGTTFWIGLHPAPPGIVDLECRQIAHLINLLSVADLLVTVDTGPMHIANALGVQVLAISQSSSPELHLSDQTDFLSIAPRLDCLNCQLNVCPKDQWMPPCQQMDPDFIAAWINQQLAATQKDLISAVIPIFKPRAEMLNRCLEAVLPQVDQIVLTRERAGILPPGTLAHPKIFKVVKEDDHIGFGRNVNYGVRHTNGKYVLVLNDDVYLAPDAVARMMEVMKPGVGVVGQLLRYPDGTLYHAGKLRQPGNGIGFPHVDLRKHMPTITEPREMENTNGASILFRRQAFYDADGYDDGFQFYAEDDDICMKIRKAGWRLWFTPLATGIHDEHQETRAVPGINQIMAQSNRRFAAKWHGYFRHNASNAGLGNFDY